MDVDSSEFEVFFDGDCPLCRREIDFLRWLDTRQSIRFTDIAAEDFSESATGRSFEQLMAQIHGRTANGQWVTGVEVFRRLYSLIGWNLLVAPTRWPLIRNFCELGYHWFARNRLWLTARKSRVAKRVGKEKTL